VHGADAVEVGEEQAPRFRGAPGADTTLKRARTRSANCGLNRCSSFEKDDHTTLGAYVVTRHGRATPLAWKTVPKSTLEGKRTSYEHEVVERLHAAIPPEVRVVLLADRGFGDQKLYALLGVLSWDYVIRFRDCILVEDEKGQSRPAVDWVAPRGRAVKVPNARVNADRAPVPAVVIVHAARMKEPWCLATSLAERTAQDVITLYGKRFSIEVDNAVDKEGARLDEIGASKDASIRILLLASMISATLSRTIVQSEKLAIRQGKKPGQPADRPPLHAIQLMKAMAVWYRRFAEMLAEPSTSVFEWNRTMGRLRSLAEDPN
jgi:hypothetical protein